MLRIIRAVLVVTVCGGVAVLHAQRGGGEWTTSRYDAQRTAWIRTDARLTKDAVQKGTFQFLWKAKFDNEPRQLNSLTQPVLQDLLIGYRGFKALAFVGGSADRVFSIDTDLARPYWTTHLNYMAATGGRPPSSSRCPGGLTATPSRRTSLTISAFGRGGGGRGGRSGSAVGEPGRGAAVLSQQPPAGRGGGPPAGAPAQGRAGAPPAGRGAAAPPGGRAVAPIGFGGVDPLYVAGSDGYLRTLRVSDGADMNPPVPFLPPNANPSALIFVDGMVYTTTSNDCGAAPNAVWALDVTTPGTKVVSWETGGANIAGTTGPAFGTDGTLYVALGSGPAARARGSNGQGSAGAYSNAVVALDRNTLVAKDSFTAEGAEFNTSPIVIRYKDQDLVAVTADDGRMFLLDGASLGGADHKTPLFVTQKYSGPGAGAGLATWESQGVRWIATTRVARNAPAPAVKFTAHGLAPTGAIVTFKLEDQNGKPTLQPGWMSRDLISPLAPIVVNDMVFAVASGEYRGPGSLTAAGRAQRSIPAVLHVFDAPTGKELWNSGKTITSFARAGLSAGSGQVYLVTYDSHLYAFGIPMEH